MEDEDFSSSSLDNSSNSGSAFANVGNLEHCVKFLNQTLAAYGFSSPLNLFSNDPLSVAQTCNCMHAILQQRQRDIDFRESANDHRQRLVSDMSRLESKVERLESLLGGKERELVAALSREQKAAATFKAQIEKLQQEKDEFQRLLIGSQQIRTQQLHDLKKKEKEYLRLQERLNQVLMEKKKETKAGMEIMSLLQKEGRQRGTWNVRKADGDFYKMIVDAYESKKHELITENADLRSLLRSMQADMRHFLNLPHGMPRGSDTEAPETPLGGRNDVFDLPFRVARDQIEESLRVKMSSIKERMLQLEETQRTTEVSCEASERELELEAQLVEARSIIQEQATLMSKHQQA